MASDAFTENASRSANACLTFLVTAQVANGAGTGTGPDRLLLLVLAVEGLNRPLRKSHAAVSPSKSAEDRPR